MAEPPTRPQCPSCGTSLSQEPFAEGLCLPCMIRMGLSESLLADGLGDTRQTEAFDVAAGMFSPGQILGGRYRIRRLLGRGGMGEVWRAYDLKLRLDVALKALHGRLLGNERALETLRREVRVARSVVSPNVCRVFDLIEFDGRELVSMEYVDGTSLLDVLRRRSPLELGEARSIAAQFLAGLEAIHAAGAVHRDVKPENLMLTRAGRVVVMDFGIAKGPAEAGTGTVAGTPAYLAPERLRGEASDARADVFAAGVVLAELVDPGGVRDDVAREVVWRGAHVEPPRLGDTPWTGVLKRALSRTPEQRFAGAAALARALEEVALRVAGAESLQPYPGLASFTAEDAEYFFGREHEVEAMGKRLQGAHLLGLIGPSGAGKSSFLRAGLLPAMPPGWAAVITTPGDRPFAALAEILAAALKGDPLAGAEPLRPENPQVLLSLASRWRRRHDQALLVVDQFEELFTQSPSEVQESFIDRLGRLIVEADVRVLLAMRDDFLFRCHEHEPLAPLFSELTPLGPPTGTALRRAVVQPALACGYRFEDDSLVDDMLAEVEGERGVLPLLAFSAARLWELRDRESGLLTREAYERIGGVAGALAQHAEATLERIGGDRIPIVRELFRNLVTAQGTRVARDRTELLSVFGDHGEGVGGFTPSREGVIPAPTPVEVPGAQPKRPEPRDQAAQVLDTFVDARLLTSFEAPPEADEEDGRQRIEIVHESLLASWPRLVRWRTQDAEGAQLRDDLRQAARMWEQHGRSEDLLWSGTAFQEFQLWRERYPGGLSAQEEAFAAAMAASATRRRRRLRTLLAAVVALALVVAGVTTSLWRRSEAAEREARAEARRAEASKLLALAQLRHEEDPTEALAYATASLDLADSDEARLFALRLLWEVPPALELASEARSVRVPQFSPGGSRLAAFGYTENVWVFAETGEPPVALPGHGSGAEPVSAFWATDELLVTMDPEPTRRVYLWRLPEGERLRTIELDSPVTTSDLETGSGLLLVRELAERPTGAVGRLRSWRLPDGEPQALGDLEPGALPGGFDISGPRWVYGRGREIFSHSLPFEEGAPARRVGSHEHEAHLFRPSRPDRLWSCDRDSSELRLWDLSSPSGEPLRAIAPPDGIQWCGGWESPNDPSGRWAVDSHHPQRQRTPVWDLGAWPQARPLVLRRDASWAGSYSAFHPRGEWLVASTHARSRLTFWPLADERPRVVDGYGMIFRPLAFSPDGKWLATAWRRASPQADQVRLWPLPGSGARTPRILPLPEPIGWGGLAFDPGGRFVFVTGKGDRSYVVPLDGSPPQRLEGFSDGTWLLAAAVSPDGRQVATAFGTGPSGSAAQGQATLRVWSLETGELRRLELPEVTSGASGGWETGVLSLAFVDEATLYTAGAGGVRRWNLASGTHELVHGKPGCATQMALAGDGQTAFIVDLCDGSSPGLPKLLDLATGEWRDLAAFDRVTRHLVAVAVDGSGTVAASSDQDGIVRVGRLADERTHLLVGHRGPVDSVAVSPDGRWIASSGEDDTLRLWPVPDLERPPLHTLPQDELIATLRSLTNLRAVRDPESTEGWKVEVGPFPGWEEAPAW